MQGLEVDLPTLLKRFEGKQNSIESAPKVWVVKGCPKDSNRMDEANGVYFRSPAMHYEHKISWSRIVWRKESQRRRGGNNCHHPCVDEWVEIKFGLGVKRRTMMGKVLKVSKKLRTISVSFGVEIEQSDGAPVYIKLDWNAQAGHQLFSFKIMRVATQSLGKVPHWVLVDNRRVQQLNGSGGIVRFAARDMSERAFSEPPTRGWHSLSEQPNNHAAPSVMSWDAVNFVVNRNAEKNRVKEAVANRYIILCNYALWIVVLISYSVIIYIAPCYNSIETDELIAWPILLIIWVEFSVTLMSGVGMEPRPLELSLFHIFVRLVLIYFNLENWFMGACIIYVVFCCRVGFKWALKTYPSKTVRDVLMEELRGALPSWMFSSGSGNNFVEQKALKQKLSSPLLDLADYVDCLRSGGSSGSANGSEPSARRFITSMLESAVSVLIFTTLSFSFAIYYVHTTSRCVLGTKEGQVCFHSSLNSYSCGADGYCDTIYKNITEIASINNKGELINNSIEQWESGALALGLVGCFITFTRTRLAYNY
jgi:hypothetical protein